MVVTVNLNLFKVMNLIHTSASIKRPISVEIVGLITSICIGDSVSAQVVNGSFENGLTGFSRIGDTSIQTSAFGVDSTQGTSQALITNDGSFLSLPAPDLEDFLGLTSGSLNTLGNGNAIEGSAIRQTFTANAGDILTFNYNFLTQGPLPPDSNFNDFSFVSRPFSLVLLGNWCLNCLL